MTIRICIMGNSHVGSIKLGWDKIRSAYPDVELEFFASPGASLSEIEIKDGIVSSDSVKVNRSFVKTGGAATFDIKAYDAYCLVGLRTGFKWMMARMRKHRPTALAEDGKQMISNALFSELVRTFFRSSPESQVLDIIGPHVQAPIFSIPDPFTSFDVINAEEGGFYQSVVDRKWGDALAAIYKSEFEKHLKGRAQAIFQPDSTVVSGFFTDPKFSVGSVRLASLEREHDENDHDHMNADFGRLLVEMLISEIRAKLTRSAAA